MSRLSYVIKRVGKMDFSRMMDTAKMLHKKTGKPTAALLADMGRCAVKYNAGYMDYKIAEMYRLNDAQRRTVITRGISNEIVRRMNDKAYWHFFDDKTQFNTKFAKWIQRDWIKADETLTAEALGEFLKDKEQFIFKPLEGSSGQGIEKYVKKDWENLAAFTEKIHAAGGQAGGHRVRLPAHRQWQGDGQRGLRRHGGPGGSGKRNAAHRRCGQAGKHL